MALGIDFGYESLKMVSLENDQDKYIIQNIGRMPIYDQLSRFDPEGIEKSQWVGAIQNLCKQFNINPKKAKQIVSSIGGTNLSVKQLTILEMSTEELDQSLEFEAKKHIPLDGTEAIIDYHILGQHPTELDKINVLLIATTKNIVSQHNEILIESGIKQCVFDADPIALVNSYLHNYEQPDEGVDVILNVGNQTSTLALWGKSLPFFSREINYAGFHFNKYIMEKHNIDYSEAETIKMDKGVDIANANDDSLDSESNELHIAEKSVFSNLTDEVRKSLRYYVKSNNQVYFNKFLLSGGSALLPGLKEFIAENLNVEVDIFNPFQNISSDIEIENPPQYAIAIGLALRGMEEK